MKSMPLPSASLFQYKHFFTPLLLLISVLFSPHLLAAEFTTVSHDLYVSTNGDIYLKALDRIVVLHGDIVVPLALDPTESSYFLARDIGQVDGYADAVAYDEVNAPLDISSYTEYDGLEIDGNGDLYISSVAAIPHSLVLESGATNANLIAYDLENATEWEAPSLVVSAVDPGDVLATTFYGNLRGIADVEKNGVAKYSIPIIVPPGTAGMAPELTLEYGSHGQNGLLGIGWSLTGFSHIHRCSKTIAQDGISKSVDFSANDAFCLDGQRLIAIAGAYGADGTEYRTELDDFSRIYSFGTTAAGSPERFKILTKAGEILEYGESENSRVEAQGLSTVSKWALNKISDTVGNYLTINYTETPTTGEHYPIAIDYSGYEGTGLLPYNSVVFEYDSSRSDVMVGYTAGSLSTQSVRLTNIKTYADSVLVKDYVLSYEETAIGALSRLTDIVECDGVGNCREPLDVAWLESGADSTLDFAVSDYSDSQGLAWNELTADFNGDGMSDILWDAIHPDEVDPNVKIVALSNGDGTFTESILTLRNSVVTRTVPSGVDCNPNEWRWTPHIADINADGLSDIYWAHIDDLGYWVGDSMTYLSNGDGTFAASDGALTYPSTRSCINNSGGKTFSFGDFNGDGYADRVDVSVNGDGDSSLATVHLGAGDGTFSYYTSGSAAHEAIPVDLNGDGLDDLILKEKDFIEGALGYWSGSYTFNVNNGDGTFEETQVRNLAASIDDFIPLLGDFNGDAINDVLWNYTNYTSTTGGKTLWLGAGDGTYNSVSVASPVAGQGGQYYGSGNVADFNGDGISDVLWYFTHSYDSASQEEDERILWLGKSDGSGFEQHVNLGGLGNLHISDIEVVNSGSAFESLFGPDVTELITPVVADFTGDGLADISYTHVDQNDLEDPIYSRNQHFWSSSNNKYSLVDVITDSNGNYASFTYKTMSDSSVYTPNNSAVYPNRDIVGSSQSVVSQITVSDGIGGTVAMSYEYGGLVINQLGLGSLGFQNTFMRNEVTGVEVETTYSQAFPFLDLPVQTDTSVNGILISRVENASASQATFGTIESISTAAGNIDVPVFAYISQRDETVNLLNNALSQVIDSNITVTAQNYDLFGNILDQTTIVSGDGHTYTTEVLNEYGPTDVDRYMGRLTRNTETQKVDGVTDSNSTRVTEYLYDPSTFLLLSEIVEPGAGAPIESTTSYAYDQFGNQTSVSISGVGVSTRTSTQSFDSRGQFLINSSNAMGHQQVFAFEGQFGNITSQTDANGIKTCWEYDSFGRISRLRKYCDSGQEVQERTDYRFASQSLLALASTAIDVTVTDVSGISISAPNRTYFDQREREIRSLTYGFDGAAILVDKEYDQLRREKRSSQPYFNMVGETKYWTEFHHDAIGRVLQVDYPSGDLDGDGIDETSFSETFSYNGRETLTNDAKGRVRSDLVDALGRTTVISEDVAGENIQTHYRYDSRSNMVETEDALGNKMQLVYDILGRKLSTDDPDLGYWQYQYNLYGELVSQTDALNQTSTMNYDNLGRIISRVEPEGISTWQYDSAHGAGIGKLSAENGPQGTSKQYTYDNRGFLVATQTDMGTSVGSGEIFVASQTYDLLGRTSSVIYPDLDGSSFTLDYHYTSLGHLKYTADTDGAPYWVAHEVNARGQLAVDEYRNRVQNAWIFNEAQGWMQAHQATTRNQELVQEQLYTHDVMGNIISRQLSYHAQDAAGISSGATETLTENFGYDSLDRITTTALVNSYTGYNASESYQYDDIGNITFKTDIGNYSYGGACNSIQAGPHAVTAAGSSSYCYDQNGNMVSGAGQNITYTSFNKPTQIQASSGAQVNFYYGANRSRLIKNVTTGGLQENTYYVGLGAMGLPLYEKVENADGSVDHLYFMYAGSYQGGQAFSIRNVTEDSVGQTEDYQYLHRDHLGSVSSITDSVGNLFDSSSAPAVEIRSYDAWGKQRNINGTEDELLRSLSTLGNLNYTGQENIPEAGFIHMNGRVYDPVIGKMLSADPTIPDPESSIGFNRYAYVFNNPMKYTDPTGFEPADTPTMEEMTVTGSATEGMLNASAFGVLGGGGVNTDVQEMMVAMILNSISDIGRDAQSNNQNNRRVNRHRKRGEWGLAYQAPTRTASSKKLETERETQNSEILARYHALEIKMRSFFDENPGGQYELTLDDIALISIGFYHHRILAPGFEDLTKGGQYGIADTILRVSAGPNAGSSELSGKLFGWQGETYWGGEVNYLGVGIVAAHRNEVGMIPYYVAVWNLFAQDWRQPHNRRQVKYGTQWAMYGALRWKAYEE